MLTKQNVSRIEFHPAIQENFAWWAAELKVSPKALRLKTLDAIRSRMREADSFLGHVDVFELVIDEFSVFVSTKPHVMIRGYGWEIEGEPANDFDGGGFYSIEMT